MPEQSSVEVQRQLAQKKFDEAISNPDVPKIYINAFLNGYNNTDFTLLLESNGTAAVVLNLSYSLAKTLAANIMGSITEIEKEIKQKIILMEEMEIHRQNISNKDRQKS